MKKFAFTLCIGLLSVGPLVAAKRQTLVQFAAPKPTSVASALPLVLNTARFGDQYLIELIDGLSQETLSALASLLNGEEAFAHIYQAIQAKQAKASPIATEPVPTNLFILE